MVPPRVSAAAPALHCSLFGSVPTMPTIALVAMVAPVLVLAVLQECRPSLTRAG
jgi:hypothetical protein